MGLFKFNASNKKNTIKKEATPPAQRISREEVDRRWKEAYRANPAVYEQAQTGRILVNATLTEDTDSLFPLVPEEQWEIEGKEINMWLITMVSLTSPLGAMIGQMDYHEAMKRLQPYVIATGGGWVLIRGMSHMELDGLFDGLPRKLM